MTDELMMPQVPEPKPEDPEDVSWALSTAEAMWARGDHAEGIKWVRRAAEAASEAEDDNRALELAKAAADLTGMITKRVSRASIDIEEVVPMSEPDVAAAAPPPVPQKPANKPAPPKAAAAPAAPAAATIANKPLGAKGVTSPSRPPAPLPSKTSQPPPAGAGAAPARVPVANKPLGTNTSSASKPPSMRPGAKKSRRSRENLENEAREAAAMATADTAQHPAINALAAQAVLPADTSETATIAARRPEDPTVASNVNDIKTAVAQKKQLQLAPESIEDMGKSTDEWDASPTQNLSGDELPFPELHSSDGERRTAVAPSPMDFKTTMQSFPRPAGKGSASAPSPSGTNPPATVVGQGLPHAMGPQPSPAASPRALREHHVEQHDPGIMTSQAVRVVVWRDANGVHVAPAGTVVSAITVEAVLVALEPHADLTAWLSATK